MENLFALPGCSILHLTTVPLCLQFILLICWTFCGMYVFRCGAFALDRLLLLLLLLTMSCYSTVIEPELKATQHMNPSQLFFLN